MDEITITKPDDWHLHLRDNDLLSAVIFSSSNHFQRALVMPNLSPPITTVEMAEEYRNRICLANKMAVDKFKLANSGENINGSENFYPYMIFLPICLSSKIKNISIAVVTACCCALMRL